MSLSVFPRLPRRASVVSIGSLAAVRVGVCLFVGVSSMLGACSKPPPIAIKTDRAQAGGHTAGGDKGNRLTAVSVDLVKQSHFVDETEALGTAKANESVDITAKTTNRIIAIRFREGQYVKPGDVLVEFDGAEARANDTVISAPFGGRVGLRAVSVGSMVTPGRHVFIGHRHRVPGVGRPVRKF